MSNNILYPIPKILLVAPYFPPTIGGSSTLLRNLFRHFPEGSYATVTKKILPVNANDKMQCRYYYVPNNSLLERVNARAGVIMIPLIEAIIRSAALREKAQMIFLNIPEGHFMIAGWWAAQRLSIPYCIYLHDLWVENERYLNKVVATKFESRILSGATILFTLTEAMRDYYWNKHKIVSKVLSHVFDQDNAKAIPPRSRAPWNPDKPFRIVTSGSFYTVANLDALRSLKRAFSYHPDENIELHIITPRADKSFKEEFTERRITVKHRTKDDVWQEFADADLFYLPLAFNSPNPVEVKTAFPTRITEYMITKVPILVHAPEDSYTVRHAQQRGWGYTVTSPDPEALWNGIQQIRSNDALRERLAGTRRSIVAEREASAISRWLQQEIGVASFGKLS